MNVLEWLVPLVWVTAYALIWAAGVLRSRKTYWLGRLHEMTIHMEAHDGREPIDLRLMVADQVEEALGKREGKRWRREFL